MLLQFIKSQVDMKIFQGIQRGFAIFGFSPNQSITQKFNGKHVKCLLIFCGCLTSSCAYLFYEAATFQEYTLSLNEFLTIAHVIGTFLIFVWKNQLLYKCMDSLEKTINKSKFNSYSRIRIGFEVGI